MSHAVLKKLQLFIAEDSELMCSRLVQILSEIDDVEIMGVAFNASDAFHYIRKTCPDVAILDICMPDGNGIDILKKIRECEYSTKVIMFTYYPYPQYKKRCIQWGADYFFDIYTEFEQMLQVVKGLARLRHEEMNPD
ncbi:MAG: response regulator transcription factor [Candidatus Aminicenantales bacterium]